MPQLRGKRSQVNVPGKPAPPPPQKDEPKVETRGLNFHWFVDVTTLLASIATVIALGFLIHDRRDAANIAAWTLLQTYLQQEHRPKFNEGQSFALETLAQHWVVLEDMDAHDAVFNSVDLRNLFAAHASFENARLNNDDLRDAHLWEANFSNGTLEGCNCRDAFFANASFNGAHILGGDFRGARFQGADLTDLELALNSADKDAFKDACYKAGHPPYPSPDLPKGFWPDLPVNPQSMVCKALWGKSWDAMKTQ
jgi:hypothetical protein